MDISFEEVRVMAITNKYAKEFARQNPKWEFKCPKCSHKNILKTTDVLDNRADYSFVCRKCQEEITITDIPTFIKDLEKSLKEFGVSV